MNITINGKPLEAASGITLEQLLVSRGLAPARTVAAVNGAVVGREKFSSVVLQENDTVELMSFVGGG